MRVKLSAILTLLIGVAAIAAQDAPRTIFGGMLNFRALEMPQPQYPEVARLSGIKGIVAVEIVFDESGVVISAAADPYDQHEERDAAGKKLPPVPVDPLLKSTAEAAARQARFAPVQLAGKPVRVKGRLLYDFVADKSDRPPRIGKIFGPLLNAQATDLPQPVYPEAARAANVQVEVTVHVVIDPEGNVIAAEATSGHPLLRAAAEEAARHAKFKPTRLGSTPTRNEGVVTYNFRNSSP